MNRNEISYEPSIYDDLYFDLTGTYLPKEGTAYEKLSVAVIGILQNRGVSHDMRIRGRSGSIYQIDGLVEDIIMVEAKDYAKRNQKVPRSDLQKQEGALIDLPTIKEGYFASATEYTTPAQKYATSTKTNDFAKPITAFDIRKSTEADEKGRIKKILVDFKAFWPEFRQDSFQIIWYDEKTHNEFVQKLCKGSSTEVGFSFNNLYDDNGNVLITIVELSKNHQPKFTEKDTVVEGQWNLDANIKAFGKLYKIKGIKYKVDIIHLFHNFEISKDGNTLMLAKCEDLGIDMLITDEELKDALICLG